MTVVFADHVEYGLGLRLEQGQTSKVMQQARNHAARPLPAHTSRLKPQQKLKRRPQTGRPFSRARHGSRANYSALCLREHHARLGCVTRYRSVLGALWLPRHNRRCRLLRRQLGIVVAHAGVQFRTRGVCRRTGTYVRRHNGHFRLEGLNARNAHRRAPRGFTRSISTSTPVAAKVDVRIRMFQTRASEYDRSH